jgi:aspartate aminotransferase
VTFCEPQGAFYIFPNFGTYIGRSFGRKTISSSTELATYLLDNGRVATIPGSAFGSDSHLRLSFALSREKIEEGVGRIASALAELT